MSKHFYHRAEQQSHPSGASFYGATSPSQECSPHNTVFHETGSNAKATYTGGKYASNQPSYCDSDAPMPSLPPVGVTNNTNFHSIEHVTPIDSFRSNQIYRNSSYQMNPMEGLSTSGSSESTMSVDRPAPAKSAFMCFSEAKRAEIMRKVGPEEKDGTVKAVAKEWRKLSKSEKKIFEDMARADKTRYAHDKEAYAKRVKGTSLVKKLRAKKNPLAPKRPMSAFLMYAQNSRKVLQKDNPDMPNADISRLLGENWKNASLEEKAPFLKREEAERKVYRMKMESWKNNQKYLSALRGSSDNLRNRAKTPKERKQDFGGVDDNEDDQREDNEFNNDQKYASTSYDEDDRDQNDAPSAFTAQPHTEYMINQHDQSAGFYHHDNQEQFHTYNDISNHSDQPQQFYQGDILFDQVAYGQYSHVPRFTYPRPDNEEQY